MNSSIEIFASNHMKFMNSFKTRVLIALILFLLSSCAGTKNVPDPQGFLPLDEGIFFLTRKLLNQAEKARGWMSFKSEIVAIQHFRVKTTGDFPKDHDKIEEIMLKVGKEFSMFDVKMLSTGVKEDYLITGFIYIKEQAGKTFGYEIKATILNFKKSLVVGDSTVSIDNDNLLNTTPIVGGPIENKDDEDAKKQEEIANSKTGMQIHESIDTEPCKQVNDAIKAFEAGDINNAITHYRSALKTKNGRRLDVCRSLYSLYESSDDESNARTTFGECVAIALEKNEKMELSSLFFKFDSTDFDEYRKKEYGVWLDEIGKVFSKENRCLEIVGHTSRSKRGEYSDSARQYERDLSLRRARAIQNILANSSSNLSGKIKVIGKGFDECQRCVPDDEGGDIDRRVEFNVIDCDKL